MKFRIERTLKIHSKGVGWAEYRWDAGSERWVYRSANEGFFREYDFPTAFSDHERLLLEIKHSDS